MVVNSDSRRICSCNANWKKKRVKREENQMMPPHQYRTIFHCMVANYSCLQTWEKPGNKGAHFEFYIYTLNIPIIVTSFF